MFATVHEFAGSQCTKKIDIENPVNQVNYWGGGGGGGGVNHPINFAGYLFFQY